ncbi:hypothetical protein [Pseudoalteromonas peptidolytica]|uniref:PH domain-containing protein n=1 Tax=Pseudoalteromonas peptidolytica F12-50-A1 TaxID=1315280 RepID=A0A8I0T272_9GAMM|nr:hypothetical protein [Pseudoalteromonas peptidolytica]MBE0344760.1 hypothetical protein [Pseudoalteromonas peptidolytica F12-50-A1]NLR14485.1 hypothetical protein [Pseudoalteromonas peptidolytica]GEK08113.1 hypothetical protein PPE03_03620 [Pseudoalteromonas peptidolytica]
MRTIELEINWLFYALSLSLIWLGHVVFSTFSIPASMLQIVTMLLLLSVLTTLAFSLTGKRFLHIDKVGVSYSCFGKTHYIHAEHIKSIKLRSFGVLSIPAVYLDNGTVKRFLSWKMTREELNKADTILH